MGGFCESKVYNEDATTVVVVVTVGDGLRLKVVSALPKMRRGGIYKGNLYLAFRHLIASTYWGSRKSAGLPFDDGGKLTTPVDRNQLNFRTTLMMEGALTTYLSLCSKSDVFPKWKRSEAWVF